MYWSYWWNPCECLHPSKEKTSYRGRKILVTQNVMCACSFDMTFTFVYIGWEWTTNDSRVLFDAIVNPEINFPMQADGKFFVFTYFSFNTIPILTWPFWFYPLSYYYVVEPEYTNMLGFLTPYRGELYHLHDYKESNCQPRLAKELFNYIHSSLRNVIDRCFGVLKVRFPILKMMPNYPLCQQHLILTACCVLHNFIRREARRDRWFEEFQVEDLDVVDHEEVGARQ